jgi:DNA-binding NarL/FixJ family response regulator
VNEHEVLIVSSDPILAWGMRELLAREPEPPPSRIAAKPGSGNAAGRAPGVLVIAPQTWQETYRWLPDLQRGFVASRWLLRAQLRLAGMFLTVLQEPPLCAVVGSLASTDEFLTEFRALVAGRPLCPPAQLVTHINGALRAIPGKEHAAPLETRELECGCAVSLGLRNVQIAHTLLLSQGSVKNSLTSLYRKLGVAGRREAGTLLEQVIFASSASH